MKQAVALAGVAAILSGCLSSRVTTESGMTAVEVQKLVHCEMESALRDAAAKQPQLKEWVGEYQLFLIVERKVSAGVTALDWVIPWRDNRLSLGFGASVSDKNVDTTLVTATFRYAAAPSQFCSGYDGQNPAFRGRLGIGEWLDQVVDMKDLAPKSVGRTIEFVVTVDGAIKPAFGIENLTGSFGATGSRQRTNRVVVVLNKEKKVEPTPVIIVGKDGKPNRPPVRPSPGRPADQNNVLEFLLLDPERGTR